MAQQKLVSILLLEKEKCCGCAACEAICPVDAIEMVIDSEGFYYPEVKSNCVNCGMCVRICSFQEENEKRRDKQLEISV